MLSLLCLAVFGNSRSSWPTVAQNYFSNQPKTIAKSSFYLVSFLSVVDKKTAERRYFLLTVGKRVDLNT
jgi:hypothetical protein